MKSIKKEKDDVEVKLLFYHCRSAKQIVYFWYLLKKNIPLTHEVNLKQFTGKDEVGPIKKAVDIIRDRKMWGFYRPAFKKHLPEINFWVSKDCSALDIIQLLSHELSHAAGFHNEKMAIKISVIASFAAKIASVHFRNKVNIKGRKFYAIH